MNSRGKVPNPWLFNYGVAFWQTWTWIAQSKPKITFCRPKLNSMITVLYISLQGNVSNVRPFENIFIV